MNTDRWPEISRVLDDVLERRPDQWPAALNELCGDDEALRREVEALLAAHERADGFLASPPWALAADAVEDREFDENQNGKTVGPYRVLRLIARGGMGRVMLAERADGAFDQQVALKLLRPGADTADAQWRFRTERQILATLDHPNIGHLLDGGVNDDGQQWLAMEYVEGLPVDRYAEERHLTLTQRLELFLTIADAVQYAHGKLVIHRDIKPANILVTPTGQPKLLDFGIAKLFGDDPGITSTPLTRTGERWMTPAYAAPEQIRGEPVTTATDVYQLGAVLYQLLSGRRPFAPEGASVRAIEDAVLTLDPDRPSQVVAASGSGTAPRARALRGDVDAIVLQALRKEPERRYGSVEALADDVRRYLARQPVKARENTLGYRARRFVKRHRIGVAFAAALLAVLVGAATALAVQQRATARERDRATAEAAKASQVTEYLMGLFEASDPSQALGDTITARELLERGVARAERLTDQPGVQATLLGVTGRVYANLGENDRAATLLRRSIAAQRTLTTRDEEQLTRTILDLAVTREQQEDYLEAGELFREVLARASMTSTDRGLQLRAQFGLGSALHSQRRVDEADSVFTAWETLLDSLPPTPTPELARGEVWLGQMLQYRGEYPRAARMLRRALSTNRAVYGDVHPTTGNALRALASVLLVTDSLDAADSLTREVVTLERTLNPRPNRPLAQSLAYRAELHQRRGDYVEAERVAREALGVADSLFGQRSLLWARITARLARILYLRGEHEGAEELYRELHEWWTAQWGADYHFTTVIAVRLADVMLARENYPEAEALLLSSYETFLAVRGEDDGWTASTAERLVRLYEAWGKPDQAAKYARPTTPS